ncbi:hypothetical protein ABGB19_20530 [Mycobacterium sp. B14F4]|uniref:hypothetical protein n=1 Tax=Mycobacterium sp. B14F4 TaxID=3153565 RepID=UPI00325E2A64
MSASPLVVTRAVGDSPAAGPDADTGAGPVVETATLGAAAGAVVSRELACDSGVSGVIACGVSGVSADDVISGAGASGAAVAAAGVASCTGASCTESTGAVVAGVSAMVSGVGSCAASADVNAPPELLTVTSGPVPPGADTVDEVCDGDSVEVSASAAAADSDVCAPPELLTVLAGADGVSEGSDVSVVEPASAGAEVDVVPAFVSVGSAQATAGFWAAARAAPTPSAAAKTPTRPMLWAY